MRTPNTRRSKVMLGVLGLVGLLYLGSHLPLGQHAQSFVSWVESLGAWGPLLYVAIFAASTWFLMPGVVFGIVAGLVFGVPLGALVIFSGAVLGGSSAFLLGRTTLRSRVEQWIGGRPQLVALDQEIGERGMVLALLLRISPCVPFNLLNGALALTRLSFRKFALTLLGSIPEIVVWVAIGAVAGLAAINPERQRTPLEWTVVGGGLLLTVTVSWGIARMASRRLAYSRD